MARAHSFLGRPGDWLPMALALATDAALSGPMAIHCLGGAAALPERAVVFAANHQSHFDERLLWARLSRLRGRPVASLVYGGAFRFPVIGAWLRATGAIPVEPGRPGEAIRAAVQRLRRGEDVLVFPEGRRGDGLGPLRRGAAVMAGLAGAPLLPVALRGTLPLYPDLYAGPRRYTGRVAFRFLPPLAVTEAVEGRVHEATEATARLRQVLADALRDTAAAEPV